MSTEQLENEVKQSAEITPEVKVVTPTVKAVPIASEPVKLYLAEADPKLSHEERIKAFLSKRSGIVRINDFLKSLYPIPERGAIPAYDTQPEAKMLRILLDKLSAERVLTVTNDVHKRLGTFYYDQNDPSQVTRVYTLSKVNIEITVA